TIDDVIRKGTEAGAQVEAASAGRNLTDQTLSSIAVRPPQSEIQASPKPGRPDARNRSYA
ncbi:hypothetical protein FRC02_008457, partial [Tulasnella sp. 418]